MRNFCIAFFALLFLCFSATNAFSLVKVNSYWDLGAVLSGYNSPIGDNTDTKTGIFSDITYLADTTSYINGDGQILDYGNAYATGLTAAEGGTIDEEGLNLPKGYEFTFAWSDLSGQITKKTNDIQTSTYSSGTIEFYVDTALNQNLGSDIGVDDDDSTAFTDGIKVATVELTEGFNNITFDGDGKTITGGSYNLTGMFSPASDFADNFWFDATDDQDLKDKFVQFEFLFGITNGDNDPNNIAINETAGTIDDFDYELTIDSRHDSSIEIRAVPEPTTMLLFGTGLLGLAAFGRRKFFKKS